MKRPYYSQDSVTIYHGDCREILPGLRPVDLVVADPPHTSLNSAVAVGTTTRLARGAAGVEWFSTLSEADLAQVWELVRAKLTPEGALYVFADVKSGLAMFPGLAPANVLVWDKCKLGMGYNWRRMHEWVSFCPGPKHRLRDKGAGDIIRVPGVENKLHPTEKPVPLLAAIIRNSTDAGAVVMDPFMGSGSTLLAAKELGRGAIGIEVEERFCELAATRLSQGVLGLNCEVPA